MKCPVFYAALLFIFIGLHPCAAQTVEKYDPRIDDAIALDNKPAEKTANVVYDDKIEEKILDKVWAIPEIQKRNAYLKSLSKEKRYLGECIYRRPYENNNFYWIKVGEDFGGIIVTHFNFYVDAKTLAVNYYDPETDSYYALADWQKSRKR
jgi:hypothetical protein